MTYPAWWLDAARLRVGLFHRPQPQVPHLVRPQYDRELKKLDEFAAWLLWYDAGKKGPRPAFDPKVPGWAWKVWGEYKTAHPRPKPAPPNPVPSWPQPPSRWKNAPWTVKHVHSVYWMRDSSVESLVDRAVTYGAKAVFQQIGNDCPDQDWAAHTRALYTAGKQAGLRVGAWGRLDYIDWPEVKAHIESVLPLDGLLADVEGRCNDQQLPEHLVAAFPGLPLGVIATGGIDEAFDGHGPQQVAARFGDYFDFVSQAYMKAGTGVTPDSMENFVYWRSTAKVKGGFRHLPDVNNRWQVPVGMSNAEGTPPMTDQVAAFKPYSPHVGWWDGEIIEGAGEWEVFASI